MRSGCWQSASAGVTDNPIGTGWILAAVCKKAPAGVRLMPAAARLLPFRQALGPSGGWWLRDRVEGIVPVRTSCPVTRAGVDRAEVRLKLFGPRC